MSATMSYVLLRWTIIAQVVAAQNHQPPDCGTPTPLPGMVVPVLPVSTSLGSTFHYACADGYARIGGSGNSVCEDGSWSTPSLMCSEKCGEAGPAPNTYLNTEDGGQTLRYTCFYSYILLSGNLMRHCENGQLTGQAPVCQLDCGSPLISPRTASFASTNTTVGSTVTYTCPNGTANIKSTSLCDPVLGSWDDTDKCYSKQTDAYIHNIKQSSLASQHDVITSNFNTNSSTTNSDSALYGADNAIDSVYGVYLGEGHCSSTAAEHKPYAIITLKDLLAVYRVVITLPNDTYAYSLDNLWVHVSPLPSGGYWRGCYYSNRRRKPGTTVNSTCKRVVFGRRIKIFSVFPHKTKGMLQLCDVHVYGDPPHEDCGKPTPLFKMEVLEPPASTVPGAVCNYTCVDGFTWIGGSGHSVCQEYGDWSKPSLLCTDEVNYAYNTTAWIVTPITASTIVISNITDIDRSTCHLIPQTTNVTITVDLQRQVEVRDISLVIPDVSSAGVRLTVSVSRDKVDKKICKDWFPGVDALVVTHMDCLQHPVGQYLLIETSFLDQRDFRLCDVWVGGRIFDKPYECVMEHGYKGSVNVTVMGIPCQRWDAQSPHSHTTAEDHLPDYSLSEAANRCRSTSDRAEPWCYTTDPIVTWQYCPVARCEFMCLTTTTGASYNGDLRHTTTGSACVSWDNSRVPIKQGILFPWSVRNKQACRNPGETQSRPWCYTKSDATAYDQCDIPVCGTASAPTYRYFTVNVTHDFHDISTVEECFVFNDVSHTPVRVSGVPSKEQVCRKGQMYVATMACWEYGHHGEHTIVLGTVECVSCGDPPPINNAYVIALTSHYPGGRATYNCRSLFKMVSGVTNSTCQENGTWTVSRLNCSIDCGQPPPVANTTTTFTGTTENHVAVYKCAVGFVSLAGDTHSICLSDGSWELHDINCTVDCGQPPPVANTKTTLTATIENHVAVYKCAAGFVSLAGDTNIICLSNGSWELPDINCTGFQALSSAPLDTTSAATITSTTLTNAVTVDKYGRTRRTVCVCRCVDGRRQNLIQNLTQNQRLSDGYLRRHKKMSVTDNRESSVTIGIAGILIMVFMFGAILLPDMLSLVRYGLNRSG